MPTSLENLEPEIVKILKEAKGQALSIPEIERELATIEGGVINTFDVRDAVWRLVAHKKAEFTPRMAVKIADK